MSKKNESEMQIHSIAVDVIHQLENSRVTYGEGDMSELMASIKQHGLMQPIGVRAHPKRQGEYELLYGNRRFIALKKLGREEVPCIIVEASQRTDFIVKNLVENLQRKDLTAFEEGRFFLSLKKMGLSVPEIAVRVNLNEKRIRNSITIFEHVPEEYQDSIDSAGNAFGKTKKKGMLNASIAAKIVENARVAKKTRREIGELLQAAKDSKLQAQHVAGVARMMKDGVSTRDAIRSIVSYKPVTVTVMMTDKVIKSLERQNGKSVHVLLKTYLEKNSEFKIVKTADLGKDKSRTMSLNL